MMKNVTTKLLLMLGLAVCLACNTGGNAGNNDAAIANRSLLDSALVPEDVAQRMIANYLPRVGVVVRGTDTLPNTGSVWFDITLLESLVQQTRAEGGSGIRFYLSAYSPSYPDGTDPGFTPPKAYWDYNTLLLVPTFRASNDLQARDNDGRKVYNRGGVIPPRPTATVN